MTCCYAHRHSKSSCTRRSCASRWRADVDGGEGEEEEREVLAALIGFGCRDAGHVREAEWRVGMPPSCQCRGAGSTWLVSRDDGAADH